MTLPRVPLAATAASAYLALDNPLDAALLGHWLEGTVGIPRVMIADPDESLVKSLDGRTPDLVIVDPARHGAGVQPVLRWHGRHAAARVLVLDRRPREAVLLAVLKQPRVSYLTRTAGSAALAGAIDAILVREERVFDPAFAGRMHRTSRGFSLANLPEGSLSMLTPRELQVMRRLAWGDSVAQCAEHLELSASTIDNHRSRLMKKLNLHKASLLTRRAVREGLIEP